MQVFRVRQIEVRTDLSAVSDLYAAHGGDYLPLPDAGDLFEAGQDGQLFVVEECSEGKEPRIHGAAGLFRMAECPGSDPMRPIAVYEMAGMVLDDTLRGYGLQRIMVALRALSLARQADVATLLIASVVEKNKWSLDNLLAQGFVVDATPGWLHHAHRAWAPRSTKIVDLVLPPEALANHADLLWKVMANPVLARSAKPGRRASRIKLEMRLAWLERSTATLAGYAAGSVPGWERSIPESRLIGGSPDWIDFRPVHPPTPDADAS